MLILGRYLIQIMPIRHTKLQWAYDGFMKTGVPLMGYDGTRYFPAEGGDDIGLFYIVPWIMKILSVSLDRALAFLFIAVTVLVVLGALWSFFTLCRRPAARLLAALYTPLLGLIGILSWDVYIAMVWATLGTIPLFLVAQKRGAGWRLSMTFIAAAGALFCNVIRSHAGTPVFLFLVLYFLLERSLVWRKKTLFLVLLLAGASLPNVFFQSVIRARDAKLAMLQPNSPKTTTQHSLWHSTFLGFSYLHNEYGTPVHDRDVKRRINAINPSVTYYSWEYEWLVRAEVIKLVKRHPYFALRTLTSKAGHMLFYFVFFSAWGLLSIGIGRRPLSVETGLLAALAFSALPGLMVTPYYFYVLGFFALTHIYAVLSLEWAGRFSLVERLKAALQERYHAEAFE